MGVDPTPADWITAVSTAGAFAAAVAAAVIAGVVVRHDRATRRAEQASRVAAWIEFRESSGRWSRGYTCVFLNTSPLPVYDVAVGYLYHDAAGRAWDAGSDMLPLVPPGERLQDLPVNLISVGDTGIPGMTYAELGKVRVLISFTDAAGRKWRRNHDGKLTEWRPPRASVRPEELVAHVARCRPRT